MKKEWVDIKIVFKKGNKNHGITIGQSEFCGVAFLGIKD